MAVRIDDVRVSVYGGEGEVELLHGITADLTAPRVGFIGENGSGKSTLAKVLAGILGYNSGTITVSVPTAQRSQNTQEFQLPRGKPRLPKELRGHIGMIIAQAAAQVIMPTVAEDVALSLRGSGLSRADIDAKVASALEAHELTDLADRPCLSLSSGQLQRLALCSVLIGEPALLIADEPTTMLDARHERLIANRLLNLPHTTQLILVTHDLNLAAQCDEVVWIHQGTIAGHGAPADVIQKYLDMLDTEAPG